jgi:hypothetical protein
MNFDSILEAAIDGYQDAFITGLEKAKAENYTISENTLIKGVRKNGLFLKYIDEPAKTIPVCIAAVKQNGDAFQFVSEEDKGISILEALQASDPFPENNVALEALKTNGAALKYMSDLSDNVNICIVAATSNGCSLEFMSPIMLSTAEALPIFQAAIKQTPFAIQYIKHIYFTNSSDYYSMCTSAVERRGELLQHVENPTAEVCLAAVQNNSYAIQWVPTSISA